MFNRDSNASGNRNSGLISQSARQSAIDILNKPPSTPQHNSSTSSSSDRKSSSIPHVAVRESTWQEVREIIKLQNNTQSQESSKKDTGNEKKSSSKGSYDPNATLRKEAEIEQEKRQAQQKLQQAADELASHPQADTIVTEALGLLGEMVLGKLGGENGAETGKNIGKMLGAALTIWDSNTPNTPPVGIHYEKQGESQQQEVNVKEEPPTENKKIEPSHFSTVKNPNSFHQTPSGNVKEESSKESDSQEKGCCIS